MAIPIQVRRRGTLTLPAELREKHAIKPGDTYNLLDLDGIFVLTPMAPRVSDLTRKIERLRTQELLAGLREQRDRYVSGAPGDDTGA